MWRMCSVQIGWRGWIDRHTSRMRTIIPTIHVFIEMCNVLCLYVFSYNVLHYSHYFLVSLPSIKQERFSRQSQNDMHCNPLHRISIFIVYLYSFSEGQACLSHQKTDLSTVDLFLSN